MRIALVLYPGLIIEYDPRPPFDAGSPETADEATIDAATKRLVAAM